MTANKPDERSRQLPAEPHPVAVFSHPNHELVALGIIHALNCPMIFLSDGGARQRIAQTEMALRIIRHRAPVLCLNYSERAIYRALRSRDIAFFNSMAGEVASRLAALRAGAVLTVPVELYNPIHDITPVLCRRAAKISGLQPAFYDVPLIHQDTRTKSYLINRFPRSISSGRAYEVSMRLLTAKLVLYDRVYEYLREYLKTLRCTRSEGGFKMEHYRRVSDALEDPSENYRVRYDARGKRLKKAGLIKEVITYRDHFLPTMTELLARGREDSERVRR
ncbi:MAG TPA: hypothetical protein VGL11_01555 [Candidatus Binatia bacterium]|jgi:hypothetical protein